MELFRAKLNWPRKMGVQIIQFCPNYISLDTFDPVFAGQFELFCHFWKDLALRIPKTSMWWIIGSNGTLKGHECEKVKLNCKCPL
jgi:hypothetical protein